ncbi:hypothetical protein SZN_33241 [Streptomyces zinciresistens K42]|uniref:Uncharacterized protein n=1 Tax=Streptomyces zinciresistens K42 TaxID=700597 RepID=G2GM96_9ACTN|nr:hypothetical protein SZN_33241 [Streptomyces zinciresistens K42]
MTPAAETTRALGAVAGGGPTRRVDPHEGSHPSRAAACAGRGGP